MGSHFAPKQPLILVALNKYVGPQRDVGETHHNVGWWSTSVLAGSITRRKRKGLEEHHGASVQHLLPGWSTGAGAHVARYFGLSTKGLPKLDKVGFIWSECCSDVSVVIRGANPEST